MLAELPTTLSLERDIRMTIVDDTGKYSGRKFRAQKRKEVRDALKALYKLRFACAYTPAAFFIVNAIQNLESAKERMSVKQWKR